MLPAKEEKVMVLTRADVLSPSFDLDRLDLEGMDEDQLLELERQLDSIEEDGSEIKPESEADFETLLVDVTDFEPVEAARAPPAQPPKAKPRDCCYAGWGLAG